MHPDKRRAGRAIRTRRRRMARISAAFKAVGDASMIVAAQIMALGSSLAVLAAAERESEHARTELTSSTTNHEIRRQP